MLAAGRSYLFIALIVFIQINIRASGVNCPAVIGDCCVHARRHIGSQLLSFAVLLRFSRLSGVLFILLRLYII